MIHSARMPRNYTYTIEVHEGEKDEKGFWISVPALPGCFTQGATYEEAVENAKEAIQCYVEALAQRGEEIPEESSHPTFVGVRVDIPQVA